MKTIKMLAMAIIIAGMFHANAAKGQEEPVLPFLWQQELEGGGGLQFSQDSKYLVYSNLHTLVYEAATGKLVTTINDENIARFTPDGLYLTTAKGNCLIRRHIDSWKVKDTIKFDFIIKGPYEFSPDGTKLAIADNDYRGCDLKHNFKLFVYNTSDWSIYFIKNFTDYVKLGDGPFSWDKEFRWYIELALLISVVIASF